MLNPLVSSVNYDFTGAGSIYHFVAGTDQTISDPTNGVEEVVDHVVAGSRTIALNGTLVKLADNGNPSDNMVRITFPLVPSLLNDFMLPDNTLTINCGNPSGTFLLGAADHGGRAPDITLNAGNGDDTFVLDFSDGNPLPSGKLNLDGGPQGSGDTLRVKNANLPVSLSGNTVKIGDDSVAFTDIENLSGLDKTGTLSRHCTLISWGALAQ